MFPVLGTGHRRKRQRERGASGMFEPFEIIAGQERMTTFIPSKLHNYDLAASLSCRLSWTGPATQPGGVARPVLTRWKDRPVTLLFDVIGERLG